MITISDGILTIPEDERFVGFSGDNRHTQKKFLIRTNPESGWLYRLYLTFDDGRHNFFNLPAETGKEGTFLIWNVEEDHIFKSGLVKAQIKAFSDKNEVYHTTSDVFVAGKATEEDEEFLNSNSEFLRFEKDLNLLYLKMTEASAKMPYVGTNGNWFTYDVTDDTYKDSGVSAIANLDGVKITADMLDREYWQKNSVIPAHGYDYFDAILNQSNAENTITRVEFSGLSPVKSVVGEGSFIAVTSGDLSYLLLFNLFNGECWRYDAGSNALVKCGENDSELVDVDNLAKKVEDIEARLNNVELVSWKSVQDIVRSGSAAEIFSVGDKFVCEHEEYGLLEWMVIGIDHDTPEDEALNHSMTLRLDTPIPADQFDAPEALFYVDEELISGNAYVFTINNTDLYFRPTDYVPIGACIVFPYFDYSSDITQTPLYIYETTSDSEPMQILSVAKFVDESPSYYLSGKVKQNDILRTQYGSNNWANSAIRQFLNSTAEAGKVWTPKTDFDRPPKWAVGIAGFLKGMDEDFLSVIGEVKKETLAVAFDNGGANGLVESTEKFFLPSPVEVYGGDYRTGEIADGEPYEYYSKNSSNASNTIKADKNRIVYYNGVAKRAFLRSPLHNKKEEVCYINSAGEVNAVKANADYNSNDIVLIPCCCIV